MTPGLKNLGRENRIAECLPSGFLNFQVVLHGPRLDTGFLATGVLRNIKCNPLEQRSFIMKGGFPFVSKNVLALFRTPAPPPSPCQTKKGKTTGLTGLQ